MNCNYIPVNEEELRDYPSETLPTESDSQSPVALQEGICRL